jgi:signal transduction histidine kinase/putative methionine-R-sulfoxide reductase with GAF domain
MGVPLNAGSETIGAITLGNRDPLVVYTEQQCNLLQAIADQAAGAIIKTRLINESERRARQLTTLNEIGRGLTSTLETASLLNQILNSAAEILNCEAGSLFMVDDQTGELIFEVTVGPVAADLIGQRLPPGTGIVGQSVDSGKPIIANDARRSTVWSSLTDNKTGFVTRDLLVVPMQLKEQIIGVIEVINKKDGSSFSLEDQDLLSTFASQAAIAIENARLYTQTDKALSARVEELSVMQRIDRELNTSLDLVRVLRISLEWSIRQSHTDAGWIGLVEKGESGDYGFIRVMASNGSTIESNTSLEAKALIINEIPSIVSLRELPALRNVVETGQTQLLMQTNGEKQSQSGSKTTMKETQTRFRVEDNLYQKFLLDDGLEQIIVPIRRTNETIGIILLESRQKIGSGDEIIVFLSRLSDHAAIAISNAQLYADLQSANLAKSEFVSLVSHELKTPMTSIKGYADLLAKGAVGPVNESQANFLNTIRSNVTRMSTLVSDLADVSRIEAGRMRLDFNAVALGILVNEVIRSTQAQIDEKSQLLEVNIPQNLPPLWADPNRIIQIVANLLSNASKYTPSGGKISVTAQVVMNAMDVQDAPEVVRVDVTDTGYGISPEEQSKIFQKFFRSEDQQIRESPGTGLGLNITRHLVEMQGGRIWFVSEPGRGTTFSFTVPVAAALNHP